MTASDRGRLIGPDREPLKGKATRTYTGAALARRQAWAATWSVYQREIGRKLRASEGK